MLKENIYYAIQALTSCFMLEIGDNMLRIPRASICFSPDARRLAVMELNYVYKEIYLEDKRSL